jgi:threonine dehydratase
MILSDQVDSANARIAPHILRTPLTYDAARALYIKWENHQKTGSFKARGALNKILSLSPQEREAGIVTASAGNHGQGVALAGGLTGAQVTCFVSEHAVPVKVNAMRALGAEIIAVPGGYPEAEAAGRAFAMQHKRMYVSAYNDEQVIAGQGTIGLEVAQAVGRNIISTYFVPVSGGGLIAGIGLALSRVSPRPRLVGVQPETAPFMHGLFYNGTQDGIPDLPSLADGLTGAVEADSVTIEMVKKLVDEIVLVSEEEIAQTVAFAFHEYGEVVEPSGAVSLAAALRASAWNGPKVAIVSGGNIQPEVHARLVAEYAGERRA